MLAVYSFLYHFVRDEATITLYKALVTALLDALDWVLLHQENVFLIQG